jgi:spore maturation protein CgeB
MGRVLSRIRTLLLTLTYPNRVSYYDDWRDAFVDSQDFDCTVRNLLKVTSRELAGEIDTYDATILLHSCTADTLEYFAPHVSVFASRKRGKLLSFVGNEYNSPYVSMAQRLRLLKAAAVDVIASQLLHEAAEYLYRGTGARILSVPHALNTKVFRPGRDDAQRVRDVGVKGYRYPPYLGDNERNSILAYVKENASRFGLTVDIGYDRRLSRDAWAEFLRDCRGTVSSESGSWYLRPDDTLIKDIYGYLSSKRKGLVIKEKSALRRYGRRMPMWVKSLLWKVLEHGPIRLEVLDDFNTTAAELEELFFRTAKRSPVYGKAIASRHFDAVGTKTCLVMLRGRFNDILEADVHYLPIDHDFSNADEQLRRFKDSTERKRVVESAYERVLSEHTYSHRVAMIRRALELS